MENLRKKSVTRKRRTMRVRRHVRGTNTVPRMCVVKTCKHIYVQLIDDDQGKTLAATSTDAKELKTTEFCKKNKESAKVLGKMIAEKAKELGVSTIVFDRGPFKYHGVLAALADSARANGLQF